MLGAARRPATGVGDPYASLQPEVSGFEAYRDSLVSWAARAVARGFRAVKAEVTFSGPYAHKGLHEPHERMTETLAAVRAAIGPTSTSSSTCSTLFGSRDEALGVLRDWRELDLCLPRDAAAARRPRRLRRLARTPRLPIAAGEWLTTRHEFLDLLDAGGRRRAARHGRVGGLTEAMRVCRWRRTRPHRSSRTSGRPGISIAAALHFAAATPHCRSSSTCRPTSGSRRCARISRPRRPSSSTANSAPRAGPGLGVELDRARWSTSRALPQRWTAAHGASIRRARPRSPVRSRRTSTCSGAAWRQPAGPARTRRHR